jgi:hypothetical protein
MATGQGKFWILTIPYDNFKEPTTLPSGVSHIAGQVEIGNGESSYRHWQIIVTFTKKVRLRKVRDTFGPWHAELSRSDAARDYCKKRETAVEGTYFELGQLPVRRNNKTDWEECWALASTGQLEKLPKDVLFKYYNACKSIARDYLKAPTDLDDVCGIWAWGPPGIGKSRWARDTYPDAYDKMCNKWWDAYQNQPNVIIDDLDTNHRVLGHHLKRWSDRYPFLAEIKGYAIYIRPKVIVVTSNYSIDQIFQGDQPLIEAIKRRFQIKQF